MNDNSDPEVKVSTGILEPKEKSEKSEKSKKSEKDVLKKEKEI